MSGTRWFEYVVMGASYPSEPLVLEELERILDAARPANIDPEGSSAIDGSFVIAHTSDHTGDIEIEVHKDWADLNSVVTRRQIRESDFGAAWVRETARAVDQIIRGRYVIERTRWRNKIIRTTVDTGGQTRQTVSRWSRLPIPERFLTHERTQLDYDCNPL